MKQHAEFGVLVLRARDGKDGPTDFGTRFSNWGKLMQLLPRKGALAIAAVIDIAINARGRPVAAKSLATRGGGPPAPPGGRGGPARRPGPAPRRPPHSGGGVFGPRGPPREKGGGP